MTDQFTDLLCSPQTTRFAPSPTGYLHLGHAYSALFAYDLAIASGGKFILRIEDIDTSRARPEFEEAILDDLEWLGVHWEAPVRRQSDHLDVYQSYLKRLEVEGLAYPCFCTRKEIAEEVARAVAAPHHVANGPEGPVYPGTCRTLTNVERQSYESEGRLPAGRLRSDVAAQMLAGPALTFREYGNGPQGEHGLINVDPDLFGDVVLARRDIGVSYHLAVVVDDHLQGVTLVTRGCDLFYAAHIQRVLQSLFEVDEPAYCHHKLICDETGRRLAKRDKDLTIGALRRQGETPDSLRKRLGLPVVQR